MPLCLVSQLLLLGPHGLLAGSEVSLAFDVLIVPLDLSSYYGHSPSLQVIDPTQCRNIAREERFEAVTDPIQLFFASGVIFGVWEVIGPLLKVSTRRILVDVAGRGVGSLSALATLRWRGCGCGAPARRPASFERRAFSAAEARAVVTVAIVVITAAGRHWSVTAGDLQRGTHFGRPWWPPSLPELSLCFCWWW